MGHLNFRKSGFILAAESVISYLSNLKGTENGFNLDEGAVAARVFLPGDVVRLPSVQLSAAVVAADLVRLLAEVESGLGHLDTKQDEILA